MIVTNRVTLCLCEVNTEMLKRQCEVRFNEKKLGYLCFFADFWKQLKIYSKIWCLKFQSWIETFCLSLTLLG